MIPTLGVAAGAALALAGGGPPLGVSVSPARLDLVAPSARTVEVRNIGAEPVVVELRRTPTTPWLRIRPARLVLRPKSVRVLTLRVSAGRRAHAGDHRILVLLDAQPLDHGRVPVRMRVGVRLRVRVPGKLIRRLELHSLRVGRHRGARVLFVSVANGGNVAERLGGRLTVTLVRRGRVVSRLRLQGKHELFPGRRAVVRLRYSGRARGRIEAVVRIAGSVTRRFRVRF